MSKKIIVYALDHVTCLRCGREFVLQDGIACQLIERHEYALVSRAT